MGGRDAAPASSVAQLLQPPAAWFTTSVALNVGSGRRRARPGVDTWPGGPARVQCSGCQSHSGPRHPWGWRAASMHTVSGGGGVTIPGVPRGTSRSRADRPSRRLSSGPVGVRGRHRGQSAHQPHRCLGLRSLAAHPSHQDAVAGSQRRHHSADFRKSAVGAHCLSRGALQNLGAVGGGHAFDPRAPAPA